MTPIRFTILSEPVSHKNGYRIVIINKRPAIVKSKEALEFEADALRQIPPRARQRLEGPVRVTLLLVYTSERADMDESLILDVMQDRTKLVKGAFGGDKGQRVLLQSGVYRNDKQVREKHVFHAVDAKNPRIEVCVEPLVAQQVELIGEVLTGPMSAPLGPNDLGRIVSTGKATASMEDF
jgi:Holliday junction resolvase RusA-like endonuclease